MNPETPQTSVPVPTPQPVIVPTNPIASGSKTMAIVALILSIVGFLTGLLYIGFALALAGIILGIVGLVKHKPGKGLNIASIIISGLCLLSLPIVLGITLASYNGITNRAKQVQQQSQTQVGQ